MRSLVLKKCREVFEMLWLIFITIGLMYIVFTNKVVEVSIWLSTVYAEMLAGLVGETAAPTVGVVLILVGLVSWYVCGLNNFNSVSINNKSSSVKYCESK